MKKQKMAKTQLVPMQIIAMRKIAARKKLLKGRKSTNGLAPFARFTKKI